MKTEIARLGEGIYTAADAARILRIPYSKANYWFQYYVKHRLFDSVGFRHYFPIKNSIAVNFLTLIEMYVFYALKEKKQKTRDIITAHHNMHKHLDTPYPFAMEHIYVMGKKILFGDEDSMTAANNLLRVIPEITKEHAEKITFSDERIAKKFYPLGKDKSVVINPENQFGHPIIDGTNIMTDTIYDYHLGGDSKEFIADLFDISVQNVEDAIEYSKAA